jgi:ethanolamine ammonia-lyase large subunit
MENRYEFKTSKTFWQRQASSIRETRSPGIAAENTLERIAAKLVAQRTDRKGLAREPRGSLRKRQRTRLIQDDIDPGAYGEISNKSNIRTEEYLLDSE